MSFSFCFSFFSSPHPWWSGDLRGDQRNPGWECDVTMWRDGESPTQHHMAEGRSDPGAVWQELLCQPQWGPGHTADVPHRWGGVYLYGVQRGWKLNQRYPHHNPEWVQRTLSLCLPFLFVDCTISKEYDKILICCLVMSSSFHCLVIN